MTLGDAVVLGMRRLEDEGCRRVMFDRSSANDDDWYGPADGGRLAPGLHVHRARATRVAAPDLARGD